LGHIFISYSRKDIDSLQMLIDELVAKDFKRDEIWYDANIEAGEHWIPQIDEHLLDASCVVVIVTKNSMSSLYVTYEWSVALGNALPVIPLLFKDSYDCIHPRLRIIHSPDCREGISENVVQQIKDSISHNSDTQHLNGLIVGAVMPTRVLVRVTLWFYVLQETEQENILLSWLMTEAFKSIAELNRNLAQLMVDKSHAFNTKQRRMCRNICNILTNIWRAFIFHSDVSDGIEIWQ
jgi:hypothetical protein